MQGAYCTQPSTANTTVDTDRQVQPPTALEACQTMQPALLRDSTTLRGIKAEPVTFMNTDFAQSPSDADTDPAGTTNGEVGISTDSLKSVDNDSDLGMDIPKTTQSVTGPSLSKTVKSEPMADTDTGVVVKFEPETDFDTWAHIQREPITDIYMWTKVKSEPITDPDTWRNIKSEPATDPDTWRNIKSEPDTGTGLLTHIKSEPDSDTDTPTIIPPVGDPAVSKTDTAVSMEPLPPREGQERLPSEPQPADKEVSHKTRCALLG